MEGKVLTVEEVESNRIQLLNYTNKMVLPGQELMNLPADQKLIICQMTPTGVIKKGPVGLYVPVGYIERCLNFVSNFKWGLKVQREHITTRTNKAGKIIHDARCLADFYIELDGKRIERSCYGSWQMYDNPAVSSFAALEAARSIATKSFADTLGIASDKLSKEFDEVRKNKEKDVIEGKKPEVGPLSKLKTYLKKKGVNNKGEVNRYLSDIMQRDIQWDKVDDELAIKIHNELMKMEDQKS